MENSKKTLIFYVSFSFLILCREAQARNTNIGSPLYSPVPAPAPAPGSGLIKKGCCRNESLAACIDPSSAGWKKFLLEVENNGEGDLKVDITSQDKLIIPNMVIGGHQINQTNIWANLGGNLSIVIDGGALMCVIPIESAGSSGGIIGYIPFPTAITSMNGAYLVFLTGLIVVGGCTWACCKRRGKQGDGITYQELEMGEQPDSSSANKVETADGWEQDWDGEWDELKSKAANGSSDAGLTSRTSKRNGREDTWDD